ncbi:putative reverse transcriptase domain-containing protein [Tanacetum coccineum]
MRDDIPEKDMPPRRRFVLTAPSLGSDVAESSVAAAARPPRGRMISLILSREEDVGYVRALYAFEHRMMISIEEVNLRVIYQAQVRRNESEDFYTQLHDAQTERRDIRLEIDVVRGQRTAYETELHEVCQAYLSFEARNRALLARLETLETHMSRIEWQRQSAEDRVVRHMIRTQVLEARARIDMVEDAGSSCAALTWWNGHVRTLGHDAAYAMTWGTLKKKLTDKYCPKGEIKKLEIELWNLRHKTLDDAIELANDLMDQKLRTYAERQNDNKRKADDSLRNNQQPYKKQNVARAYTAGPGEKKAYTRNLSCATKIHGHIKKNCPNERTVVIGTGNGHKSRKRLMLWEEEMLAGL